MSVTKICTICTMIWISFFGLQSLAMWSPTSVSRCFCEKKSPKIQDNQNFVAVMSKLCRLKRLVQKLGNCYVFLSKISSNYVNHCPNFGQPVHPVANWHSLSTIEILDLELVCWHRSCKYVFWGEITPCKKTADLHPKQGNLL
jgi:hypothetical protein